MPINYDELMALKSLGQKYTYTDRDGVHLTVTDDGPGFDEDAIKAGHGLDNLQRRLLALYGKRASLEFFRPSSGMTVRLRVPAS